MECIKFENDEIEIIILKKISISDNGANTLAQLLLKHKEEYIWN